VTKQVFVAACESRNDGARPLLPAGVWATSKTPVAEVGGCKFLIRSPNPVTRKSNIAFERDDNDTAPSAVVEAV